MLNCMAELCSKLRIEAHRTEEQLSSYYEEYIHMNLEIARGLNDVVTVAFLSYILKLIVILSQIFGEVFIYS